MENDPSLPFSRFARFLRQYSHDVRNTLNGLDLEAALIADIVTDPDARESIARLRAQVRETATSLRGLATKVVDPQPSPASYSVRDLFLIWQDEAAKLKLEGIKWTGTIGSERVNVDATGLAAVFHELLANAKQFGDGSGLAGRAEISSGQVAFELHEQKSELLDPAEWGNTPFLSTRRGAYGLGLWQSDRFVRASGGKVERAFTSDGKLVTRLIFPLE